MRYEFFGQYHFPNEATRLDFEQDVAAYIASHGNLFYSPFPGEPPTINRKLVYHDGLPYQLVRAHVATRTGLNTIFQAVKNQVLARGADGGKMWLKEVEDARGVIDVLYAEAPDWTDHTFIP